MELKFYYTKSIDVPSLLVNGSGEPAVTNRFFNL